MILGFLGLNTVSAKVVKTATRMMMKIVVTPQQILKPLIRVMV
jgi:hypothetical protein